MVCAWNSSWGNKGVSMKNSVEVKNISFSYGKTEILKENAAAKIRFRGYTSA